MNKLLRRRTVIRRFIATSTAYLLSTPTFSHANNIALIKLPSSTRSLSQEQIAAHLVNRLGFGPRPGDLTLIAEDPAKSTQRKYIFKSAPGKSSARV
jgi:hypothetical protein